MSFTSSSVSILSAEGTRKNEFYYDSAETTVSNIEVDHVTGRFEQALNTLNFGSTSQILIPNSDLCYQCFLTVELGDLVAEQTLPRGWLFSLIREINYTWGQANVSQLRMSGKSILQVSMASASTKEARNEILTLAGEAYNSPNTKSIYGTICIPLPWSSLCPDIKPFDTSLLNNPIQLQITLNDASSIYGGSGVVPTSMVKASVFLRQGVMTDRSNSIKNQLMSNSGILYQVPFIHKQSPSTKYLTGTLETEKIIEVTEFLEADLYAILMSVHYTSFQKGVNGSAPSPQVALELLDLEVLYNGQTVYKCPGNSSRLLNMLFDEGSSGYSDTILAKTSPYSASPVSSYYYQINMGFMKDILFKGAFDNTSRFSTQTMQIRFRPQRALPTDSLTEPIEVHFTYCYSALAAIQSGVTNITFS